MAPSAINERLVAQPRYGLASCSVGYDSSVQLLSYRTTTFAPLQCFPPPFPQLLLLLYRSKPPSPPAMTIVPTTTRKPEAWNKAHGQDHRALSTFYLVYRSRPRHSSGTRHSLCCPTRSDASYCKHGRTVKYRLTPLVFLRHQPCEAFQGRKLLRRIYDRPGSSSNLTPPLLALLFRTELCKLLDRSSPTRFLHSSAQ